jgi:hypothetical protein
MSGVGCRMLLAYCNASLSLWLLLIPVRLSVGCRLLAVGCRWRLPQKRCRLSCWPTAPSHMSPNAQMRGEGGVAGSQPMSTAVHRSPNKLWISDSIFGCHYECRSPFLCRRCPTVDTDISVTDVNFIKNEMGLMQRMIVLHKHLRKC